MLSSSLSSAFQYVVVISFFTYFIALVDFSDSGIEPMTQDIIDSEIDQRMEPA